MVKNKATVSTSQIISEVASKFEALPKKVTKEMISCFLETIEETIVAGTKVRLDKIGIMQTKMRKARIGRNPQTGEEIKIPASKKVGFRASKSLKEAVGVKKRATSKKK